MHTTNVLVPVHHLKIKTMTNTNNNEEQRHKNKTSYPTLSVLENPNLILHLQQSLLTPTPNSVMFSNNICASVLNKIFSTTLCLM